MIPKPKSPSFFILTVIISVLLCSRCQYIFPCTVPNCQVCTYTNFCGLCNQGFILYVPLSTGIPSCQPVQCSIPNCTYCMSPNQCEECNEGYQISISGKCRFSTTQPSYQCPDNCLVCNSGTSCLKCSYGYTLLQNSSCASTYVLPGFCRIAAFSNVCQLCEEQYAVSPNYLCIQYTNGTCNVQNCHYCTYDTNNCTRCNLGYQLSNNTEQPQCILISCKSIQYCISCSSPTSCSQCQPGYLLTNGDTECSFQLFSCTIPNCLICGYQANMCSLCKLGYYAMNNQTSGYTVCVTAPQLFTPTYYNPYPQNCKLFGYIRVIIESKVYGILCVLCQQNYIMVAGQCLPQLGQLSYNCNILNCVYCIFNNYCGLCDEGFRVVPYSGGLCSKIYSPVNNCVLSDYFSYQFGVCNLCKVGYILLQDGCYPYDSNMVCQIPGCNYCLSSGVCTQCLPGYNQTLNAQGEIQQCINACQTPNCMICLNVTACSTCNQGYYINFTTYQCQVLDVQQNCTQFYGSECTACNTVQCTACAPGYSVLLPEGYCCQNVAQNIYGCLQYENNCSLRCTSCLPGFLLMKGQCLSLPCTTIPNCQYCFRSQACIVCQQGYALSKGQCTQMQNTNCSTQSNPYCSSCTGTTCTSCSDGYKLINNQCYCSITNCLQCMGSAFCYKCAYPLIPDLDQGGGCVPIPIRNSACQIPNCAECVSPTKCSLCNAGYSLNSNNRCIYNQCPANSNCQLCNPTNTICYLCQSGYTKNQVFGQKCVAVPQNYSCNVDACSVCQSTNANICVQCIEFYSVTDSGKCGRVQCIQNCQLCMQPNTCIICNPGFYLNTSNICQQYNNSQISFSCSQIQFCLLCRYNTNTTNQTVCSICMPGYQLSPTKQSCIPQTCTIINCQICMPTQSNCKMCLLCQQGYYINSYMQCVPYSPQAYTPSCNIYNCLYCAYSNICTFCSPGYLAINGTCAMAIGCSDTNCALCTMPSNCIQCQPGYALNTTTNICYLNCNIANCLVCQNTRACQTCDTNYTTSVSGTQCICLPTFQNINGSCQCPPSYGYSASPPSCILCSISNCLACSSANVCAQCTTSYVPSSDNTSCICPDASFVVFNNKCVCPTGALVYNGVCVACSISNCIQCQQPNICSLCATNFVVNASNQCQCPQPYTLMNSNLCQCPSNSTYYDNQCISCNIANCLQCQSANECTTCNTGYLPSSSSNQYCVLCNITGCQYCQSINYCTQCTSASLSVNSQGNQCVECNIGNCGLCSRDNVCEVCSVGYVLGHMGNICVRCSAVAGCLSCSADDVCAECMAGFMLNTSSNMCLPCAYPCQTCASSTSSSSSASSYACTSCQLPYSATPSQPALSITQCYLCLVPNCISCSSPSSPYCLLCSAGYNYYYATGTCQYACQLSSCAACTSTGVCLLCQLGYVLPAASCVMCAGAPACQSCSLTNTSICLSCAGGYLLADSTCIPCPGGCQQCNTNGQCLAYKAQTGQISVMVDGMSVPAVCDPGCLKCSSSNPSQCILCYPGYHLQVADSSSTCSSCSALCKTCSSSSSSFCLSCYNNMYLSNGQCLQCTKASNCLTCASANLTQCITCPVGYSLSSSGTCTTACQLNCLSCQSTYPYSCTLCQQGYSPNYQGICLPCISNCKSCSSYNYGLCTQCSSGFYLSVQSSANCIRCPSNCIQCTSLGCSTCGAGYILNYDSQCIPLCTYPCATCSQDNASACTSCLAGYTFGFGLSCEPVTACYDGCSICPYGYILSQSGQCQTCNSSNCARCSPQNLSRCLVCNSGYYLSSPTQPSSCMQCPSQCSTCTSSGSCLSCAPGYTALVQSIVIDQIVCVLCAPPCATCLANPNYCTSCISGYYFQGSRCVSSFNFGFYVNFDTDLMQFYQNYGILLQQIASSVQAANINVVNINSIYAGAPSNSNTKLLQQQSNYQSVVQPQPQPQSPVNIYGTITLTTPPSSNQATNNYMQLTSLLSQGNTIGNMLIASSTVTVNGGQIIIPSNNGSNLGLILGICIPLAILVLAVIGYFVYRKIKDKQNEQQLSVYGGETVRPEVQLSKHFVDN